MLHRLCRVGEIACPAAWLSVRALLVALDPVYGRSPRILKPLHCSMLSALLSVQPQILRREWLVHSIIKGFEFKLHLDRKSTRLNSSHEWISYAVFCLKKKN